MIHAPDTDFFKRGTLYPDAKPGIAGTRKLSQPTAERGQNDLEFRSSIEGNQSLYTLHGDDMLMVVYWESVWPKDAVEKQELPQPPEHFGSDSNCNMWILRRMVETKK